MIRDGKTSHIRSYKEEVEHNGGSGDPLLLITVLDGFIKEIKEDMSQTTLPVDKPDLTPKKITADKKAEPPKK